MSKFDPEELVKLKTAALLHDGLSTMRRELGVLKADPATDYIRNLLDSGTDKVVLFAHHKEVLLTLKEKLKAYSPVLLYGPTPKTERQAIVEKFQSDKDCRVFIGGIIPCGEGITLTAASRVIFAEFSWVPGQNAQCEDRCHRIGQRDSVIVDYLVYPDSLDYNVLKSQSRKSLNIREVMQ